MQVPPFSLKEQLEQLGEQLDAAVLQVLRSGQYIGGGVIAAFEAAFAQATGCPYAIGCNSGTDALILALRGLGIGPGDEVITCSFSFFATAEAISAVGATPVFVDVDESTYLINLDQLEAVITPATKALLPVHLFGRPVGSWGDVGCFSFFPTKNLGGAGDGGAVTCRDQALAQRMRELAVHGMPRRYLHTELGYNSRLDAIQAAVLNVKLPLLTQWVQRRQTIAATYRQSLSSAQTIALPEAGPAGHSWNQFVVRVPSCSPQPACSTGSGQPACTPSSDSASFGLPEACCRDWLKQQLQDQGITTIIYYPIPIHRQPAYASLGYGPGSLPITERLCSEVLSLPIFPELSATQQERVIEVLLSLTAASAAAGSGAEQVLAA
jgi:dTDP-4-amino-4,6-dideoxygalactose transaminase